MKYAKRISAFLKIFSEEDGLKTWKLRIKFHNFHSAQVSRANGTPIRLFRSGRLDDVPRGTLKPLRSESETVGPLGEQAS